MNNRTQVLSLVLISSLAAAGASTARGNGGPVPQVAAQDSVVSVADPSAQVTSQAPASNAMDNQVTVRSVETSARQYGPKPSFDSLDTNHDGVISESEAEAYPPLANDYLHVAHRGSRGVTRSEYEHW